jgi:hypothetical protein
MGDGTEVEGFGTLAQNQGAKAVIASLWPVADESTSLLMQEFYRRRESAHESTKLEALRQAQISLLRGNTKATTSRVARRGLAHVPENESEPARPKFTIEPDNFRTSLLLGAVLPHGQLVVVTISYPARTRVLVVGGGSA